MIIYKRLTIFLEKSSQNWWNKNYLTLGCFVIFCLNCKRYSSSFLSSSNLFAFIGNFFLTTPGHNKKYHELIKFLNPVWLLLSYYNTNFYEVNIIRQKQEYRFTLVF